MAVRVQFLIQRPREFARGLAAQLFRLAKAARGADADALEIYKLSDKQAG